MGPVKVTHLLYIFLCNWNHWNHSQPLEEERVSGMFQGSSRGFSEVCNLESLIVLRKTNKHWNIRETEYLISAST